MIRNTKIFFQYVIPSILAFALSGIYSIVDGFFVGNQVGDAGLSAINVAYPIVALIQAAGTGIGMGGAVCYSIHKAENREKRAREYTAGTIWMLFLFSILLTILTYLFSNPLLRFLGADGQLLSLGGQYIKIIAIGASLQIIGTGLVPFIRNNEGAFFAMTAMAAGFVSNIILDYLFVWVKDGGIRGAAWATIISQGITMLLALVYLTVKRRIFFRIPVSRAVHTAGAILKIGIAPFGLAMTPNLSLMIINRFSAGYGGEEAIATYACIAYIICIIYLILQGVGDGSQPLMSLYYGQGNLKNLKDTRALAYEFALFLSVCGVAVLFLLRWKIGILFGASLEVNYEIGRIMPVFLLSVPFVAVSRITTSGFYATEKSLFSYFLTFMEPVLMFVLMLILPPLLGGQQMIWWSTTAARILSALAALIMKREIEKRES